MQEGNSAEGREEIGQDGVRRRYYPSGVLRDEVPLKGGVKEGEAKTYGEDGALIWSVPFRGGKREGDAIKRDSIGRFSLIITYVGDKEASRRYPLAGGKEEQARAARQEVPLPRHQRQGDNVSRPKKSYWKASTAATVAVSLLSIYLLGLGLSLFLVPAAVLIVHRRLQTRTGVPLVDTLLSAEWYPLFWTVFLPLLLLAFVVGGIESPLYLPPSSGGSHVEAVDSTWEEATRLSCDSVESISRQRTTYDSAWVTWDLPITGALLEGFARTYSNRVKVRQEDSSKVIGRSYLPLENCGDTIMEEERRPYEDEPYSLVRITSKYYDEGFHPVARVHYRNKSERLSEEDIRLVFNGARKRVLGVTQEIKYRIKLIDMGRWDTLAVSTEAEATLEVKERCKDKATYLGKLVYSEYDSCVRTSEAEMVSVTSEERVCGTSRALLYSWGVGYQTPESCQWYSEVHID